MVVEGREKRATKKQELRFNGETKLFLSFPSSHNPSRCCGIYLPRSAISRVAAKDWSL